MRIEIIALPLDVPRRQKQRKARTFQPREIVPQRNEEFIVEIPSAKKNIRFTVDRVQHMSPSNMTHYIRIFIEGRQEDIDLLLTLPHWEEFSDTSLL